MASLITCRPDWIFLRWTLFLTFFISKIIKSCGTHYCCAYNTSIIAYGVFFLFQIFDFGIFLLTLQAV